MLILAEKPNVAESFALALSVPFDQTKKYYTDGRTVITHCRGHLFELVKPEEYDPKYKRWSFENLPIIPNKFRYKMIESTARQTRIVLQLLQKHKNDKIVIATDADREGEVIARIVFSQAGLSDISNCHRFWVSQALTTPVILDGLEKLKPWSEYNNLAQQGFARQHADWLVGMNLSPYATLIGGRQTTFSVGRVQTAILAAIAQRNNEIKNFVAKPYYQCVAHLKDKDGNNLDALLINPTTSKTHFPEKDNYIEKAKDYGQKNKIIQVSTTIARRKMHPPQLLSLTALQKKAANLWNYSAATTLEIAQKLYDEYKCMSYPRTPSSVLGDDDVSLFQEKFDLLKANFPISRLCDTNLIAVQNKHVFNSKKLDSHHALIPLDILPAKANEKEANIYNLVTWHFFVCCMPDCIYDETKLAIQNGDFAYTATVKKVVEPGWKAAPEITGDKRPLGYSDGDDSDKDELRVFDETTAALNSTEIVKKFTTPKKEFTETSLLAFMENPTMESSEGKLVGLGTPATRASILEGLLEHEYVTIEKKKYFATSKGHFLLKLLFKNPLTAKIAGINNTTEWEKQLDTDPLAFERSIISFVTEAVSSPPEVEMYEKESIGSCPLCGKRIQESKSNYYCVGYKSEPKCEFTIWKTIYGANISISDVRQLLAGKITGLKKLKSKDGKEFSARLKLEGDKVSFVFDKKKKLGGKK